MRVVNRIVNILVLVFAIAAAVFSYLLFEKREKLVSGWEQMAQSISQAAKALDEKSGTKLSVELKPDTLNHKNFNRKDLADLEKALPKLPDGAKKIIAQRDALAESLNKVARNAEVGGVNTEDLKKLATSQAKQKIIEDGVARNMRRNEQIFQDYVKLSRAANVSLSIDALKKNPESAYKNFQKSIDAMKLRIRIGDDSLAAIARLAGVSANLRAANYQNEMKKIQEGVQRLRKERDQARRERDEARRRSNTLDGTVKNRDAEIKRHKETIAQKDREIADLRNKLYGTMKPPTDAELYATIQGRIENVNPRWKFVVINLGAQMPTVKKSRTEERMFMMPLMKGFVLTVARNLPTNKPEYVGKITVTQVGDNYAVANIDVNSLQSEIKTGDSVYFTADDTAANLKLRSAKK